ncbi:MAG: S8 family serine peptidase, partial [Acidimicrobiaceae bacterium]|nr:S8 family serine peptidase [Acidimicrobiaceae bacterium]
MAGVVASGGVAGRSSAQAPPQTASDWSVAIAADAAASAGRLAGSASAIVVHDPVFGEEQDCGEHRPWLADELSGCLWHLNWRRSFDGELGARPVGGDINIGDAWKITKGGNVAVAVVDDTWNPSHHDIADNVDLARSHNYASHPLGESTAAHATSAAGVIAARDNELGGRGIAPRATLYNYNLIEDSKPSNSADAMKRNAASVAVSNNSYGQISLLPKFLWVNDSWWKAVDYGLAHGFGGKGTSYVFSAGNDKSKTPGAGDVNLSEFLTHPGVIGACAVNNGGRATSYSHEGAALWVCAPSNDKNTETQRSVGNGILAPWGGDQYRSFGRTSAATAEVSGVVALVRSANPHLSWRDVKLVLAATAQKNDPSDAGWSTGALQYGSTTNRYSFNRKYGFGVVDAAAAVNAALAWKRLPSLVEATARAGVGYDDRHHITANLPEPLADIDDDALTTELTLAGPSSIDFLEHVSATLYISSSHARDLRIELVSPSGTTSTLIDALDSRSKCPNQRTGKHQWNSCFLNLKEITLASNEFLGEDPEGTWKLKITDALSDPSDAGHWNSSSLYGWWLDFAGHAGSSADNAPRARLKVNAVDDISVRASEGTTVRVSATLSGGTLASDVVLPVSVVAGTATAPGSPQADYSVSGPLRIRIRAGRTSGSAAFTIVRDALDEHDETLTVKWQDPGSGQRPNSVLYLGDPIEVTIDGELDPPPPPRTVTLEATPQRVAEGSRVQITARLTGGAWTRAIKLPVSFGPGTASGPFKFPRDHQILTQGSQGVTHITIPAGATSATYSVLVFDDRNHVAPEPDETFSIVAYRPSSLRRHVAVAGSPLVVTIIGDRQRALMPEVSVTAGSSVIEGSAATFTLTASPSPQAPLTVSVTVAQTGDFGVSTGSKTVTIPTSGTAHLNVATVGDSVDEADGSVTAAVTADNSYTVSISSGRATVAVSDDDPAPPPERDPPSKACVTADATLLAQVQAKAADPWGGARADLLEMFTRSYRTMQGADTYTTADIKARADKQEPNWQGIGPNPLWQKIYAELDRLETCRAAPPPPPDPEVSVTAGPGVTEGGSASFTVTADPAPTAPLAVSVTVAQTGDYAAAGTTGVKTVTIPTSGSKAFTVATVNDGADEADGSVAVTLDAGTGYTVSSAHGAASVAVADDD